MKNVEKESIFLQFFLFPRNPKRKSKEIPRVKFPFSIQTFKKCRYGNPIIKLHNSLTTSKSFPLSKDTGDPNKLY
jgi:hypothetical protein